MKSYCVDDFIRNTTEDTIATIIDKKISLLYDFCILRRQKGLGYDPRENRLRYILSQCSSECAITNSIHPILVGDTTLNEFLKSKLKEN